MFRRIRETAPAGLVPLAWGFTVAAHLSLVSRRPVLIAHLVMDVLLVAFVALSWSDMREGVLRAWRTVILVGIPVTLVGTAGLLAPVLGTTPLLASVVGWMLLPAPAFLYTGRESTGSARVVNYAAAALSIAGAATYLTGVFVGGPAAPALGAALAGLVVVGVGQTVGIVDAVVRY